MSKNSKVGLLKEIAFPISANNWLEIQACNILKNHQKKLDTYFSWSSWNIFVGFGEILSVLPL